MLKLDHESLEPFEPLIAGLFDCALGDALRGLASAGLKPGDEWHTEAAPMFRAACLPGFKKAQNGVGSRIVGLEEQIASLRKDEAKARGERKISVADGLEKLRHVLENRQLVLRRLMDAMLWVLIWPRRWLLRRLRLEGHIRRVNVGTIKPLLEAVDRKHSKPDETFLLICDLTTVAQLGDVIIAQWNPDRNAMKIVVAELKVGATNILLRKLLRDSDLPDLNATISKISQDLGSKAAQQAARMAKQERRLKDFERVIATDEGTHPVSGQPFRMTKDAYCSKDYRDEMRTLVKRAKSAGSAALTLDECLHLLAVIVDDRFSSHEGLKAAHAFYHMRHGGRCEMSSTGSAKDQEEAGIANGPKVIELLDFNMRSSLAMPPLLWYPRDIMLDVLMGRIRVFAQFDHEKFFEIASGVKLKMAFLRGKEAAKIKNDKLSGPLIEYRDTRYVSCENVEGVSMFFGSRFSTRVYMELIRPTDMLGMVTHMIEESTKRGPDPEGAESANQ